MLEKYKFKKRISAKTYSLLDLLLATVFISLMAINSLKEEVKWVLKIFQFKTLKLKLKNVNEKCYKKFQRLNFHIILWPRNFDSLCTFCFICCQKDECCWILYMGLFLCQGKFFRFILFRFKLFRRVWKLPGTSHLRFFPRIILKVDFLFQNSRVDRSYWYHF